MPKQSNNPLLNQLIELSLDRSAAQSSAVNDKIKQPINASDTSRIVEMAWEDRTPFEAIEHQFGLAEADVIELMRNHLHHKSFKLWRQRVSGRPTKHRQLRPEGVTRAYCPTQYKHRR